MNEILHTFLVYVRDLDGSERLGSAVTAATQQAARVVARRQLPSKLKISSIERLVVREL